MQTEILMFGNDPMLLRTRQAILRSAQLEVSCVEGINDLHAALEREHPRLLMLCSSLAADHKRQAVNLTRENFRETKILLLAGVSDSQAPEGCYEFDALSGPAALVRKAAELLKPSSLSGAVLSSTQASSCSGMRSAFSMTSYSRDAEYTASLPSSKPMTTRLSSLSANRIRT